MNFMGSYCVRTLAAVSKNRKICGSVAVAQRAMKYNSRNISRPPEQTVEKIEGGGTQTHREEKEFSFGAKDRQGPRQRPLELVDSSWSRHVVLLRTR
jgi:hypothetical protein